MISRSIRNCCLKVRDTGYGTHHQGKPDDPVRIVVAGGGFTLASGARAPEELVRAAMAQRRNVQRNGALVTIAWPVKAQLSSRIKQMTSGAKSAFFPNTHSDQLRNIV
jgi:hypothetical protein